MKKRDASSRGRTVGWGRGGRQEFFDEGSGQGAASSDQTEKCRRQTIDRSGLDHFPKTIGLCRRHEREQIKGETLTLCRRNANSI